MTRPTTRLRGWNNKGQKKNKKSKQNKSLELNSWLIPSEGINRRTVNAPAGRVMGRNAGTLPSAIQMSQ